jgi:hypothetical protein
MAGYREQVAEKHAAADSLSNAGVQTSVNITPGDKIRRSVVDRGDTTLDFIAPRLFCVGVYICVEAAEERIGESGTLFRR